MKVKKVQKAITKSQKAYERLVDVMGTQLPPVQEGNEKTYLIVFGVAYQTRFVEASAFKVNISKTLIAEENAKVLFGSRPAKPGSGGETIQTWPILNRT